MAFTDPFSNTPPTTITVSRGAAFDNTSPGSSTPGRGAAFSNTAPTFSAPSRGAAFDNTAAGAHDLPLSPTFNNTKPGIILTGDEYYFAVCAPTGNQNLNQLIAGATVAGVTLVDGNLVLITQANQAENNGIFLVNGAGAAATRVNPMTKSLTVRVGPNSTNAANKVFLYTPLPNFVLGTTHITFVDTTAFPH